MFFIVLSELFIFENKADLMRIKYVLLLVGVELQLEDIDIENLPQGVAKPTFRPPKFLKNANPVIVVFDLETTSLSMYTVTYLIVRNTLLVTSRADAVLPHHHIFQ
jgi:hypothetical protein